MVILKLLRSLAGGTERSSRYFSCYSWAGSESVVGTGGRIVDRPHKLRHLLIRIVALCRKTLRLPLRQDKPPPWLPHRRPCVIPLMKKLNNSAQDGIGP